jgi:peptidylprolyl isomerase
MLSMLRDLLIPGSSPGGPTNFVHTCDSSHSICLYISEPRLIFMAPKFLRSKITLFLIIFLVFIGAMITYSVFNNPSLPKPSETSSTSVLLITSMGNITIALYDDMPITTENFVNLTELGIYDNTIFHRVVSGYVIQGGDPTGTGQGDPSIATIPDELPNKHSNVMGTVAMAKRGNQDGSAVANSASSQFFINLVDNSANLDSAYPVFGKVVAGMDVVAAIGTVQVDTNDRPIQPVTLIKAIVLT